MRLVKVPQSSASRTLFTAFKLGPWELGRCVAPHRECNEWVFDDGTGYADLDGTPFKAYVCRTCATKLLEGETA